MVRFSQCSDIQSFCCRRPRGSYGFIQHLECQRRADHVEGDTHLVVLKCDSHIIVGDGHGREFRKRKAVDESCVHLSRHVRPHHVDERLPDAEMPPIQWLRQCKNFSEVFEFFSNFRNIFSQIGRKNRQGENRKFLHSWCTQEGMSRYSAFQFLFHFPISGLRFPTKF